MLDWLPPRQISTFAGDIDSLIALIYYLVGAWFLLLHLLLVYMLIRYRRREGRPAQHLTGASFRQSAWILLPAAVVLGLDLWVDARGAEVWARVKEDRPPADLTLRVTGEQFNWKVQYPGPDGRFDTQDDKTFENTLHVPVNKVIAIELRSNDVLHSFFLPDLRLKQDAVPGRQIPIWFEAVETGRFELACAELCGFGHTGMRGFLAVDSQEDYDAWVAARWRSATAPEGEERAGPAKEGV